jgi:hypothetical protein
MPWRWPSRPRCSQVQAGQCPEVADRPIRASDSAKIAVPKRTLAAYGRLGLSHGLNHASKCRKRHANASQLFQDGQHGISLQCDSRSSARWCFAYDCHRNSGQVGEVGSQSEFCLGRCSGQRVTAKSDLSRVRSRARTAQEAGESQ